jgi:rhodanese-related sulfurtransferase
MFRTISISELFEKQKNLPKDALILDVRTPEEFEEGHIPGSRNISHESVAEHSKELQLYRTVYLYCRSGRRVDFACDELVRSGLRNVVGVVQGGMPEWIASGYPVEK